MQNAYIILYIHMQTQRCVCVSVCICSSPSNDNDNLWWYLIPQTESYISRHIRWIPLLNLSGCNQWGRYRLPKHACMPEIQVQQLAYDPCNLVKDVRLFFWHRSITSYVMSLQKSNILPAAVNLMMAWPAWQFARGLREGDVCKVRGK